MAYSITENCIGCTSCANLCPADAISGEKKKHHTIDSVYCIECGTCGRICPKNAVADPFGQVVKSEKRKYWKKPEFNHKKCSGCGICVDACPVGCIAFGQPDPKSKTAYPELINLNGCLSCGFCAGDCPVSAIVMAQPSDSQSEAA